MNPLKGLLVIALEQAVAAPYCSSRLADAGARVIKIEREEGDFARHYDDVVHGESAYFVWLNRGKESLTLDIKAKDDTKLLQALIKNADVFIQNLAPGAANRAGFDSATLRDKNKKLITVDISGYGPNGPYQNMKAYDLLVQCETGLAGITGAADEPGRVGVSVCDIACGMNAHAAILEALIKRGITGEGSSIEVSLFDSLADWMTVPLLHQEYGGVAPKRMGLNHPTIAPYGVYTCLNNEDIVISIQNEREWQHFYNLVLEKDLSNNSLFLDNPQRCQNRSQLDEIINSVFNSTDRKQIIERLTKAQVAYGAVNSVSDLSKHPQLRRTLVSTPTGPVNLVTSANDKTRSDYGDVPAIGEHSEAIRKEFSFL
ncbi:MAG: itaconate CoA-transferase [Candidatus Azotimanducaceae bacterium]